MNYCFVIPCYQHSKTLESVLNSIDRYNCKVFVIDDGSDPVHSDTIAKVCSGFKSVELTRHSVNQGKGGAVMTGLLLAEKYDFTHAIQVDSDGQHDLSRLDILIEESKKNPQSLISGLPVYDESVPRSRLIGRYITHAWVWIETLSLKIKDSMCGFRVYPVQSTVRLIKKHRLGRRMDFDIEVMVRLYWAGLNMKQIPVSVCYPEGGQSHFKMVADNWLITKMHTRLFFSMFYKMPLLWMKKALRVSSDWHMVTERTSLWGIKTVLFIYGILGRRIVGLILYPICFYYYLFSAQARRASKSYISIYNSYCKQLQVPAKPLTPFFHIYSFASMIVDKFSVWKADIKIEDLNQSDLENFLAIARTGQGALFLSSHYGNIEVCRALGRFFPHVKFNALVYYENAKKFNDLLEKIHPEASLRLISVKDFGIEHSIDLKEKVDRGEWIFMMGDRLSARDQDRFFPETILGRKVRFPEGPFLMAYLLDVPVFIIHCFRQGQQFRIKIEKATPREEKSRTNRRNFMSAIARSFASEVEARIMHDPKQWYNFFGFWIS